MADKNQTWNIAQNFVHFRIYLFKNAVKGFTKHIWLDNLIIVVNGQDSLSESRVKPEDFILGIFVKSSTQRISFEHYFYKLGSYCPVRL